jgi:hypothetical protein
VVADIAVSHGEGILTESGVGPFDLALEEILADHPGSTNSHGIPYVEYIHSPTFRKFLR